MLKAGVGFPADRRCGKIPRMAGTLDRKGESPQPERPLPRLRKAARRLDSRPGLVAAAEALRRVLPGDEEYGDALSTAGDELPQHLGRLVAEVRLERPSAARELGLGALQAWQALSESQRRGRGVADVAILFTDLVEFSSWALEAGDEAVLRLLRLVGDVEDQAISGNGGVVVKRLGDGVMAVFQSPTQAVQAAIQLRQRVAGIEVDGHRPELRAGVHLGRPRKIGTDYLGVDVNVAARVADAAGAGEILVSQSACEGLDPASFKLSRGRRLRARGAPEGLSVCAVN
jgi:adenylate cyclase